MAQASGWIKRGLQIGSGLLLALITLAIVALLYLGIPQNAAGMAAKGVCSAAFVAGRPWQKMLADDVLPASPVLSLISIAVDENARSVTARFAGLFARQAVLMPHRGCVLNVTPTSASRAAAKPAKPDADKPWPQGEAALPVAQWSPGVDALALQTTVDEAFAGAGDPNAANARGVAIIHKGRLLVLRTAPGFSSQTPLHGWSMTKTVTGMLMHKLAADTHLSLDSPVVDAFPPAREPAWVAPWRTDGRKRIKVSDLLYMRDGLASSEDYQPWGSVPHMLWGQPNNVAAFAAASAAQAPPGARWRYLSATANLLSGVARGRFTRDADYWAYPAHALFEPIGATSAVLETDTDGNWVGSSYLWASAGDWGRLGQLMLNDGHWGDTQVLPPGWLQRAARPSTTQGDGLGYGAQTWRIGDPVAGECRGRGLPADTLSMSGHWGQVVAMVPSRAAVIVRLGWTFKRGQFDACAFIADILKTLPK